MSDLITINPARPAWPVPVSKSITFNGNAATYRWHLWTLTGTVEICALAGVVTTQLSSNFTACYWTVYDGTADTNLTAAAGPTMSSFNVNSLIAKTNTNIATAASVSNATTNPPAINVSPGSYNMGGAIAIAKASATTNIDFIQSTTNNPQSGVIKFWCWYRPISQGSSLV